MLQCLYVAEARQSPNSDDESSREASKAESDADSGGDKPEVRADSDSEEDVAVKPQLVSEDVEMAEESSGDAPLEQKVRLQMLLNCHKILLESQLQII